MQPKVLPKCSFRRSKYRDLRSYLLTLYIFDCKWHCYHDSISLPESVGRLHKVYNNSDYARYVLIKWYLQGKACITDILTQDKPSEKEKVIF